ncbi:MAG TPA: hypothetical protein VKB77_07185, partial [Terriglobales bacterium]|nr:hypothetical protein [Terriglobales bacterium]
GLAAAAAWVPWLLAAFRYAIDGPTARFTALGAAAGGMMILAGYFQTAFYGFLVLGLYATAEIARERANWLRALGVLAGMSAGAVALGAIQILPGLELTAHTIRAGANFSNSTEGVLHLGSLATLFAPDALGALSGNYHGPSDITQYYFYAGLLLVPLAVLGAVKATRVRIFALAILAV